MTIKLKSIVLIATAMFAATACSGTTKPTESAPTAASDQTTVREAVFFGDSLTDAGTYGFRFTTNPGLSWAQIVSERLGQPTGPNVHVDDIDTVYQGIPPLEGPGGLNYAQGGARANAPYSSVSNNPEGAPWSTAVQVDHYLAQRKSFAPDQLVTLFVGTNDVAYHYDPSKSPLAEQLRADEDPDSDQMRLEITRVEAAADDAADTAETIIANGAKHLMVFELYDLDQAPWFKTAAARTYIRTLTDAYNKQLTSRVENLTGVSVMDTGAFIDNLIDNQDRYGFQHGVNEDACREVDQDYCDSTTLVSSGADQSYVFAGSVHFTTKTNQLIADWVTDEAMR
ncbi:SGNH/GDSL hydrolase family protein [Rhodococcus sp. IEGM 1381]|uniref:SGNH/GDSL hydrolase family protein n=1 Tax=Rhodococcus sp. IEGM 1381 TaxID=3047085 RepID=UPI0024B845C6|nr:SGNH/GDSL hydrolase family protein [Rhodococcus sp. IEGM 1381]MDI9893161.1 SGNH/GDSL hydrolase family protein [Rhodococcus sp. IEGM 1381]